MASIEPGAEWDALREENDSLRQECQELRTEIKDYEDFINHILELLPPSYDSDDSQKTIIISFLRDMESIAQVIAKLTSDYR